MKQYLSPEQTAKLIELGFEKPKTLVDKYYDFDAEDYKEVSRYSIGELIEMLPQFMDVDAVEWSLSIVPDPFKVNGTWWVFYAPNRPIESAELIDVLYFMLVKLKEEEVI